MIESVERVERVESFPTAAAAVTPDPPAAMTAPGAIHFRNHDYLDAAGSGGGGAGAGAPDPATGVLIGAWICPRNVSSGLHEIACYHNASNAGVFFATNGSALRVFINNGAASVTTDSTGITLVAGRWQWVGMYMEFGVANSIRFYHGLYDSTGESSLTTSSPAHIAAKATPTWTNAKWFVGGGLYGQTAWMRNLCSYDGDMDEATVAAALYAGGQGVDFADAPAGVNTWWNLDETAAPCADETGTCALGYGEVGSANIGFDQAGPTFLPTDVESFVGYLDKDHGLTTDTGGIDRWEDRFGGALSCGQTTEANRPTLHADGAYCENTNDVLDLDSAFVWSSGDQITIVATGKKAVALSEMVLFGGAGNANFNLSSSISLADDVVVNDGVGFTVGATAATTTIPHVTVVECTGSVWSIWKNGTTYVTAAAMTRYFTLTKLLNRGTAFATGSIISDVALFSAALTASEKRRVASFQAQARVLDWAENPA